jgi:hypothetical protein
LHVAATTGFFFAGDLVGFTAGLLIAAVLYNRKIDVQLHFTF